MRAKTLELWMMAVTPRYAPEHCTREQALSPERHQTSGVQVLGMERPEAHSGHLAAKLRSRPGVSEKRRGPTLLTRARGG